MFKGFILHHLLQECQMENFKIAPSNKTEYDSKGIAPSFESHFKEPKRNFKIASSLEMLQQVLTNGFTNLEVFLKENQIENLKLLCN